MPHSSPRPQPDPPADVRADIWLWAVRQFKTRALAATACRGGKVQRNQIQVKPSTALRPGDVVKITTDIGQRVLRVESLITRRVGAPEAAMAYTDLTDPAQLAAARTARAQLAAQRLPGHGRPTKHDRRELDRLRDALHQMGYGKNTDEPPDLS